MEDVRFWTTGKVAGLLVFLLAVAVALAYYGISRLLQKDGVYAQMASPDGRLVARIWCTGSCWQPGRKLLTISPATRDVGLRNVPQVGDVFTIPPPQEGDVPRDDVVTGFRSAAAGGAPLRWTGPRALLLSDTCLTDENWRQLGPKQFNGVAITFVAAPLPPHLRGGYEVGGHRRYLSEELERCDQRGGA